MSENTPKPLRVYLWLFDYEDETVGILNANSTVWADWDKILKLWHTVEAERQVSDDPTKYVLTLIQIEHFLSMRGVLKEVSREESEIIAIAYGMRYGGKLKETENADAS